MWSKVTHLVYRHVTMCVCVWGCFPSRQLLTLTLGCLQGWHQLHIHCTPVQIFLDLMYHTAIKNLPISKAPANAVEQKGSLILLIFGIFRHAGQQTAQANFTIQIITNQMYTRNLVQCPNDRSQPWTLVVSSLVMLENYRTTEKS